MRGSIILNRPLPSFDAWLEQHGDGNRGEGFEAFEDLARRTLAQDNPLQLTRDEAAFLRLWKGMQVACIELLNIETAKHDREAWESALVLPRVVAAAAFYAISSVIKDDAPYRPLAKVLIEEFRFSANLCADTMERSREAEEADGGQPA